MKVLEKMKKLANRQHKYEWIAFSVSLVVAAMIVASTPTQADTEPSSNPTRTKQKTLRLPETETAFGFVMINKLSAGNSTGNIFISPLSLHSCLQMAYDGAAGTTSTQMAKVLGLSGLSVHESNKEYKALLKTVADPPVWLTQAIEKKNKEDVDYSRNLKEAQANHLAPPAPRMLQDVIRIDPPLQVEVANSIWANNDTNFAPQYVADCKEYFRAQVRSLNFADRKSVITINDWVSKHTNGKIENAINQLKPRDLAILVNVAYFKARWSEQFDPEETKPAIFHTANGDKKVSMMHQGLGADYLENAEFQAVRLQYRSEDDDNGASMYIFLPRKRNGLAELLPKLTAGNWKRWREQFGIDWPGQLSMPRFEVSYEAQCSKVLASLGMPHAFSSNKADFSKMVVSSPKLFLSEVYHKTFVKVDEEGTEAAAYTVGPMGGGSEGETREPFKMVIDHPFFFAIINNKTGAPLFMGTMSDPTLTEAASR